MKADALALCAQKARRPHLWRSNHYSQEDRTCGQHYVLRTNLNGLVGEKPGQLIWQPNKPDGRRKDFLWTRQTLHRQILRRSQFHDAKSGLFFCVLMWVSRLGVTPHLRVPSLPTSPSVLRVWWVSRMFLSSDHQCCQSSLEDTACSLNLRDVSCGLFLRLCSCVGTFVDGRSTQCQRENVHIGVSLQSYVSDFS